MARFGEINAQYFDDAGDPLSSGKIYFYETGTTTLKDTFSDINQTIANTNPVILTAAGRQPNIFFSGTAKAILVDKNDVQILVRDPVGQTASVFGDGWVATKIYSADAVVLGSDGQYYRSLAAGNQNNDPTSTSGYWTLLYSVEWNAGITYQTGAVVTYNNLQYQSLQNSNLNNNPSSATAYWASIAFAWLSTRTYAINENVVGTDGILYTSLQNSNTGNVPASSGSYWVGTSAAAAASATTASEWAIKNSAAVSGTDWSAFANASGAAPTGSSKAWATTAEDSVVAGGEYSAKHYSAKSSASATASAASATTATTKASEAATSASTATTKASEAATSATNAATSATNSATSATASANSATAAASSATDAANKYDEFDDRYLGQKSSDPSTDNDGNALVTGAIYFNTTTNVMRVYNGSAWQNVAPTATSITLSQVTDVTATAAEVNLNDGSVAGTIVNGKTVVYGASGEVNATTLQVGGTAITSTPQELNVLDGIPSTLTATELGYVDGVTSSIQNQIDNISPSPTLTATASGALANGDTVIVNSDGTVSAVSGSGATENLGSNQVLNSATSSFVQVIYDTQNDKMILFYKDSGNDIRGRVCTVSGDTISAGTEQLVYTNNGSISYMAFTYAGSGKFVFMAGDSNVNGGVSAVGSVSGTTITMGSTVQFGDNSNDVERMGIAYDENAGKVVAFWQQSASPYHSFAAVGTISGTTLSYGTPVTVTTSRGWFFPDSIAYDSTAQKLICCYMTFSASEYCRARVGTVSGTSISFGTEITVRSAITDKISATYDPDEDKTIVFFRDSGSGYDLRASVLTVSGTDLTASTAVTIIENQAQDICSVYDTNANKTIVQFRDVENTNKSRILVVSLSGTTLTLDSELTATFEFDNAQCQIAFDPDTNKVLLGGNDTDNSNYATAAVYTTAFTSTNLTAENYIGISDGAYSNGNTATIQIVGSVDDAQSSLTAGQTYYISFDGSLVLTPITPSVTAGTAVSATKIIVKG